MKSKKVLIKKILMDFVNSFGRRGQSGPSRHYARNLPRGQPLAGGESVVGWFMGGNMRVHGLARWCKFACVRGGAYGSV